MLCVYSYEVFTIEGRTGVWEGDFEVRSVFDALTKDLKSKAVKFQGFDCSYNK